MLMKRLNKTHLCHLHTPCSEQNTFAFTISHQSKMLDSPLPLPPSPLLVNPITSRHTPFLFPASYPPCRWVPMMWGLLHNATSTVSDDASPLKLQAHWPELRCDDYVSKGPGFIAWIVPLFFFFLSVGRSVLSDTRCSDFVLIRGLDNLLSMMCF